VHKITHEPKFSNISRGARGPTGRLKRDSRTVGRCAVILNPKRQNFEKKKKKNNGEKEKGLLGEARNSAPRQFHQFASASSPRGQHD